MRLTLALLGIAVVGVFAGAWLVGMWAVGVMVMATSGGVGYFALVRDIPDRPADMSSHDAVIEDYRRAR